MTERNTWHSSGAYLLKRLPGRGGLEITDDYIRAFLARPELAPVEESCAAERALHAALLDDPLQQVGDDRLAAMADADAQENFRIFLTFRDLLASCGTLEKAYLAVVQGKAANVPPLFVEQMVHAIMAGILHGQPDPLRWRAAEVFFRPQNVSTGEGQLMQLGLMMKEAGGAVLEEFVAAQGAIEVVLYRLGALQKRLQRGALRPQALIGLDHGIICFHAYWLRSLLTVSLRNGIYSSSWRDGRVV